MVIYIKGKRGEGKTTLLNFIKKAVEGTFTTGGSGVITDSPYECTEWLEIGNPGRRMADTEDKFCPLIGKQCIRDKCIAYTKDCSIPARGTVTKCTALDKEV